jgi:hypothetical protein
VSRETDAAPDNEPAAYRARIRERIENRQTVFDALDHERTEYRPFERATSPALLIVTLTAGDGYAPADSVADTDGPECTAYCP